MTAAKLLFTPEQLERLQIIRGAAPRWRTLGVELRWNGFECSENSGRTNHIWRRTTGIRHDPIAFAMLVSCGSPSRLDPKSSRSSGLKCIHWAPALVLLSGPTPQTARIIRSRS